jgi:type VI secretion system protein ImpA
LSAPELDQRFLAPCPGPNPAGEDLSYCDLWLQIREARRHEEPQDLGIWTRESKEADWPSVFRLCNAALVERSKDLRLAIWRLEASLRLQGFTALRSGLTLLRELIEQYWDSGLHPHPEEPGDTELRLSILNWLNDRLAHEVRQTVLARNPHTGFELCFDNCVEARFIAIGKRPEAVTDLDKVRETLDLLEQDQLFSIRQSAEASVGELIAIEKWLSDKFGFGVISFRAGQEAIDNIARLFTSFAPTTSEPTAVNPPHALTSSNVVSPASPQQPAPPAAADLGNIPPAWIRAEDLVRLGSPQEGISEMARLVASVPCGREVFIQKLNLAETCLATGVDLLSVSIFEELAEQIDIFKLEQWEPSDLIGRVWLGLYKCYRRFPSKIENIEKAARVYARFCRLNPWKAYDIGEPADLEHPSRE